jgi:hypothetical protein
MSFSKIQHSMLMIFLLILGGFSPYRINDGFSLASPMRELSTSSVMISAIAGTQFPQSNQIQTHPQKQLEDSIKGEKLKCSNSPNDRIMSPIYLFLWQKKGSEC